MSADYNVVVLGAGGIGSAAFFHAARRHRKVLALDQFGPAHDRGSSHGVTRIIRQAYFEHPDYVPLLRNAYELWRSLEQNSGRRLFFETGLLEVGDPDGVVVRGIRRSAAEHGVAVEEISDSQFSERFPAFQKAPGQVALFERNAGYLLVEQSVAAHLEGAVAAGGEFRSYHQFNEIRAHKNRVAISTDAGDFFADRVIVTAGAWSGALFPWLAPALQVRRKHQYWFPSSDARLRASSGCPTYFFDTAEGHFYGFPALDDGLAKVARHSGGDPVADPTRVDRSLDEDDLARVQAFMARHWNAAFGRPTRHAVCMYTMSPDEHFIIDRHPDNPQIVYCAGLSGHGFKFATVLGQYLNELSEGRDDPRFSFLKSTRLAVADRVAAP